MARPASRIAGARIDYDLQNQTTFNHNHNWQGESSTGAGDGVSYGTGDIVIHNNHLYISLVTDNENNTPPASGSDANWRLLTTDATGNFSIPVWAASTAYTEGTLVQHSYTPTDATEEVTRIFESLEAIPDTATAEPQNDSSNWADIAATVTGGVALGGLTDVTITSPENQQVLEYDTTTSMWVNRNLTANSLNLIDLDRDESTTPPTVDLTASNVGDTIQLNNVLNVGGSTGTWNVETPGDLVPIQSSRSITFRLLDDGGNSPDQVPYFSNINAFNLGQFDFSLRLPGVGTGLDIRTGASLTASAPLALSTQLYPGLLYERTGIDPNYTYSFSSPTATVDYRILGSPEGNFTWTTYNTQFSPPLPVDTTNFPGLIIEPAGGTSYTFTNTSSTDYYVDDVLIRAGTTGAGAITIDRGSQTTFSVETVHVITAGTASDTPVNITPGTDGNFRIERDQTVTRTIASTALRHGNSGLFFSGTGVIASTRRGFIDNFADIISRGLATDNGGFGGGIFNDVEIGGERLRPYDVIVHHFPRYSELILIDRHTTSPSISDFQFRINVFSPAIGIPGGADPQFGPNGTSTTGLYPIGPAINESEARIEIIPQTIDGATDLTPLPLVTVNATSTTGTIAQTALVDQLVTQGNIVNSDYTFSRDTANTNSINIEGPFGQNFRVLSGFTDHAVHATPTRVGEAPIGSADFALRPTLNGGPIPLDVSQFPNNAQLRVNSDSTNLEVDIPDILVSQTTEGIPFTYILNENNTQNVLRPISAGQPLTPQPDDQGNVTGGLSPDPDGSRIDNNITSGGRPTFFISYDIDTTGGDTSNIPEGHPALQLEYLINNPSDYAAASGSVSESNLLNFVLRHGGNSIGAGRFGASHPGFNADYSYNPADGSLTLTNIRTTSTFNSGPVATDGTIIPGNIPGDTLSGNNIEALRVLTEKTITGGTVRYETTEWEVTRGQRPSINETNDVRLVEEPARTAYFIGIDAIFDNASGVERVIPTGNNVPITAGGIRRYEPIIASEPFRANDLPTTEDQYNLNIDSNGQASWIADPIPEPPSSTGDYVLQVDSNNDVSWTQDQDIMVQSGAVDVSTRQLNLFYNSTATGAADVSIDISNLGTHDSFGLHIAGARDYDVSSVTRTVGSTSLVTVAFDSETTRNDFFRHVLGTTSTAARIGTTLNFESHTGIDPDGDDTPIATFALSPGGFFSAGNNSNEVILDPDTIAEGNAFIEAFNTATHTTLSSGDNTLRWENSATVTQLVGNDDITPLISTDGSSFTLNLPDEGVGGTVMRTSAFPNTGAERTANNTPINVHKAYNFTTLAAGTDDLGARTSEVITLRVNNRTIEAPADGQLSVGGTPIVTRTDLEDWSGRVNYSILDEVVFQSSLYRARLDVTGNADIRNDVGGVIDARFADVNDVSTLIIDFDGAPLIPLTVTPPGVSNYSVQFAVEGTPTVVRFNGTHVTRDTTTNTWNVARSDTHYNATLSPPLQGQVPDGFRSDRASTWVYESNTLATPPLNPGLNTADWERLSNPFGGDSSGSIPEWESGGTITEGQLYYYSGDLYRSHSTIHGAGNQTTPNMSTDFDKIGEVIARASSLGGLEFFPYGSMILDDTTGNVGEVWMQINSTAQPYDPSSSSWVNLNTQTFTRLADTPSALGTPGQNLQVNAAGTGLEFVDSTSPAGRTLLHDWNEEHAYTTDEEVVYNSAIYRARLDVSPSAAGGTEIIGITQMTLHEEFFEIGFDADHPPVAGTTYHVTFTDPITNIKHLISFDGANIINNTDTNNAGPGDTVDGSDRRWFVLYSNGTPNLMSVVGYQGAHVAVTTVRVYTGSNPDTDIPITHASHFSNDYPRTSGFNDPAVPVLRIEFDLNNPVTPLADTVYTYSFSFGGTARAVTFNGNDVNRAFANSDAPSNFNWFIRRSDLTGVPAGLSNDFYPDQSSTHLRASSHESNNNPGLDTDNWERLSDPRDAFAITVWEERTGYVIGDVVVYEGELFRALVVIPDETGNTAVNPNPTDAADWQQLSYKETEAEPFRSEDLPSTDGNYVMNRDTVPASHSIVDMGEWFGQAENQSCWLERDWL